MDYIFWLIIGLVLMAIELVIPGGIAGLIGYCLFMWGVFIGLGGTDIALYAVLGITIVLVVVLLTFFNHFAKDLDRQILYLRATIYDQGWLCI